MGKPARHETVQVQPCGLFRAHQTMRIRLQHLTDLRAGHPRHMHLIGIGHHRIPVAKAQIARLQPGQNGRGVEQRQIDRAAREGLRARHQRVVHEVQKRAFAGVALTHHHPGRDGVARSDLTDGLGQFFIERRDQGCDHFGLKTLIVILFLLQRRKARVIRCHALIAPLHRVQADMGEPRLPPGIRGDRHGDLPQIRAIGLSLGHQHAFHDVVGVDPPGIQGGVRMATDQHDGLFGQTARRLGNVKVTLADQPRRARLAGPVLARAVAAMRQDHHHIADFRQRGHDVADRRNRAGHLHAGVFGLAGAGVDLRGQADEALPQPLGLLNGGVDVIAVARQVSRAVEIGR